MITEEKILGVIKNQVEYKLNARVYIPALVSTKKSALDGVSQMLCLSLKFDLCSSTTFQLLPILLLANLLSGNVVFYFCIIF